MRDPRRIDHVLGILKRVWQQEPDLRLCQLISNAVGMATKQETTDCFYIEDDVLLKGLELYIEEIFRTALRKKVGNGPSSGTEYPVQEVRRAADATGKPSRPGEVQSG